MNARCLLCAADVEDVLDHLRLIHPDAYGDGPLTWPDGSLVVVDETLTPEDFGGAA